MLSERGQHAVCTRSHESATRNGVHRMFCLSGKLFNSALWVRSHAIVSSLVGPEYYVNIMSFVDKTQLEPGCSILLHNKVSCPAICDGITLNVFAHVSMTQRAHGTLHNQSSQRLLKV